MNVLDLITAERAPSMQSMMITALRLLQFISDEHSESVSIAPHVFKVTDLHYLAKARRVFSQACPPGLAIHSNGHLCLKVERPFTDIVGT